MVNSITGFQPLRLDHGRTLALLHREYLTSILHYIKSEITCMQRREPINILPLLLEE